MVLQGGRTYYGPKIGILMMRTRFPRIPGDPGNAATFPFPVSYRVVPDLFPAGRIPADADEDQIQSLAETTVSKIISFHPCAVMCQGEFTLTFAIVSELLRKGIHVVSACSERDVQEEKQADGSDRKIAKFRFVRLRAYRAEESAFQTGGLRHAGRGGLIREGLG